METIEEAPEESEKIYATVKFPNWLYWRSGYITEDSNGVRTFYYRMGRRLASKVMTSETLIKKPPRNNSPD